MSYIPEMMVLHVFPPIRPAGLPAQRNEMAQGACSRFGTGQFAHTDAEPGSRLPGRKPCCYSVNEASDLLYGKVFESPMFTS